MPKLSPKRQKLNLAVELLNAAHAHRLAIGWLVAREAGIQLPPSTSLVGGAMERWDGARNLPAMLKVYQPQARLMYRLRSLCLQLHNHPKAQACGGPEQWWQRILEEDILSAIGARLAPEIDPTTKGINPPTTAASIWWMRRGVNPCNPQTRPATWALIEAVQARVFPTRGETPTPDLDVPLPIEALNGVLSLSQRRALLASLTGSSDGLRPNASIEITRDWLQTLNTWQLTAKETKTKGKSKPTTYDNPERFTEVAHLINTTVMPSWWANIRGVLGALNLISENKPSVCKGFDPLKKIQQSRPSGSPDLALLPSDLDQQAKRAAGQGANQSPTAQLATNTSKRQQNRDEQSKQIGKDPL